MKSKIRTLTMTFDYENKTVYLPYESFKANTPTGFTKIGSIATHEVFDAKGEILLLPRDYAVKTPVDGSGDVQ
jgi:hypothetical protein